MTDIDNPYAAPASPTHELTSTAGVRLNPPTIKGSWVAMGAAASPAMLMLALFYSLAIHMHQSLGGWPTSIGVRGFPSALVIHATIATHYFSILLMTSFLVWPVAFLACVAIRRCRFMLRHLGTYALSCLICFGALSLAPPPFLYWWWD